LRVVSIQGIVLAMKRIFMAALAVGMACGGVGFAAEDSPKGSKLNSKRAAFREVCFGRFFAHFIELRTSLIKAYIQNPVYINMKFLDVKMTGEGMEINIFDNPKQPIFKPRQTALTDYGKLVVSITARKLERHLVWFATQNRLTYSIEVRGHVGRDFKPAKKGVDALTASNTRALAVYRQLIEKGAIKKLVKSVSGHGSAAPSKKHPTLARISLLISFDD
jgi:flagellar motor protein MotB